MKSEHFHSFRNSMSFQLTLYINPEFIKHAKYLNCIKKITRCLFVIMLMVNSEAFSRVSKPYLGKI